MDLKVLADALKRNQGALVAIAAAVLIQQYVVRPALAQQMAQMEKVEKVVQIAKDAAEACRDAARQLTYREVSKP